MIAFSIGDFQQDIYVVGADGTGEMQLTSLAGTESGATVSGDGSLVAFYHFPEDDSATGGVWRVELAGGEPELLVEGASNPAYGP